ncbi:NAD(P)-binding protein [Mycena pura]|uniref:NAD(P)-binding protein n=1 Tax=Mycena pura TaxID=153505 RepID=A0AAD6YQ67_9AGAR|nr:NAD(P)-binding protein [Mycena pura]
MGQFDEANRKRAAPSDPIHRFSFAVVGGGAVGSAILQALAAKNVSVVLLSRPTSAAKGIPPGVKLAKVDYTDVSAVADVFKEHKVDVVLSTLGTLAAAAQKPLVDAAKQAGVKLFVPSEYGVPTDGQTEGVLADKNKIAEHLKSVGIPSTRIFTGNFIEYIPWLVGYSDNHKITIVGKGDTPCSFTSTEDIAAFVAYVLTTLPPPQLEDKIFRLEGDRMCLNDLGPVLKAPVEYVDHIVGKEGELKTALLKMIDVGAGSTGWDNANKVERSGSDAAGTANALWPGHQWKKIKDAHTK